jgi:DNA polymerase-3 subunit alpha
LSYQDALSTPEDLIHYAKLYNAPSLAVSDHHNLCAWPKFYNLAKKAGIKPIASCEMYFQWHDKRDSDKSSYHLLLTVKNEAGWRNLLKLMYLSNIPVADGGGFYYRPRITEKMLYAHKEGLIVSSACVSGPIAKPLLAGNEMEARMIAEDFRNNLDDFFIEIMPHRLEIQSKVNSKLVKLGKDMGIPVITTLDIHFADSSYEDAYLCNGDIRRNRTITERNNPQSDCLRDPDFYYKSIAEIYDVFDGHGITKSDIRESIANTVLIDNMIDFSWQNNHFAQPKYSDDADRQLELLLAKKIREKFGSSIPQEYKDRTRYEFNVIRDMGFSNYFLILNDAIDFCGRERINVGPGRGSAASSLLLWLLGITNLDPLKYNLPFERFLNKDRTGTVPDVDVDLDSDGREKLITYLKSRWGEKHVVQLINYSQMKPKAAISDAGKWLEVDFKEVKNITAAIPAKGYDEDGNAFELPWDDVIKVPQVQKYIDQYPRLFEVAGKLVGSYRQPNVHAGAVCILPEPADEIIPVMQKRGDQGADCLISQWDKKMSELVGVHKYDFLGLSTLKVLKECEDMTGVGLHTIDLENPATWRYFQEGKHMLGIFQFMEDKTRSFLRQIKPERLQDLSDVNTLIRPGADSDLYLKNRKSKMIEYKFDLPEVKEELKNSYGAIIYQENIMNLANKLADFTLGEGDMLRRALEKNDAGKIAKYKEKFVSTCKYPDIANDLFDWIGANAAYLFNKSHALTYSLIGFWCAYYKANFPHQFLVANLRHPKSSQKLSEPEYIANFIQEAKEMGISVELPRLGKAYALPTYDPISETVYYGLVGIKGISENSAYPLSLNSETNFADFVTKSLEIKKEYINNGKTSLRPVINKGHIKRLCLLGFFGDPGEYLKKYEEYFKEKEEIEFTDYEDAVNDAVGFSWFSPLTKYEARLPEKYNEKDRYVIMKITYVKKGNTRGRDWTMIKGATNHMGDTTAFLSLLADIKKGDVILCKYKRGRNADSISIEDWKLLD